MEVYQLKFANVYNFDIYTVWIPLWASIKTLILIPFHQNALLRSIYFPMKILIASPNVDWVPNMLYIDLWVCKWLPSLSFSRLPGASMCLCNQLPPVTFMFSRYSWRNIEHKPSPQRPTNGNISTSWLSWRLFPEWWLCDICFYVLAAAFSQSVVCSRWEMTILGHWLNFSSMCESLCFIWIYGQTQRGFTWQ